MCYTSKEAAARHREAKLSALKVLRSAVMERQTLAAAVRARRLQAKSAALRAHRIAAAVRARKATKEERARSKCAEPPYYPHQEAVVVTRALDFATAEKIIGRHFSAAAAWAIEVKRAEREKEWIQVCLFSAAEACEWAHVVETARMANMIKSGENALTAIYLAWLMSDWEKNLSLTCDYYPQFMSDEAESATNNAYLVRRRAERAIFDQ